MEWISRTNFYHFLELDVQILGLFKIEMLTFYFYERIFF